MVRRSTVRRAIPLALLLAFGAACHHRKELVEDNELLYERAREAIARRKFLQAIEMLGDVGLVAPVGEALDPLVKLALADAYFYQGGIVDIAEAQNRYEQFVSFYPNHPRARYARFQAGVCKFRQAEDPENDQEFARKALEHFEAMLSDLPEDDPWRFAAAAMLERAQDRLAEHEWLVARFYLRRGRDRGAVGRLEELVTRYPGSRRREQALYELALAQRRLGHLEASRDALRRLLADYPEGPLRSRAERLLEELEAEGAAARNGSAGGGGGVARGDAGGRGFDRLPQPGE
ncbi:MAG: outer membrane protein assembly factor BamD [Acidobacteria bacterium]|nr:MAG: outer membrane protein assembly factor BamD [Acidobacteriota bacterium]